MKNENVTQEERSSAIQSNLLQDEASLPARRLADITPATREQFGSVRTPTSPKMHELMERHRQH